MENKYNSRSLLVTLLVIFCAQYNLIQGIISSGDWANAIMLACIMYGGKRVADAFKRPQA